MVYRIGIRVFVFVLSTFIFNCAGKINQDLELGTEAEAFIEDGSRDWVETKYDYTKSPIDPLTDQDIGALTTRIAGCRSFGFWDDKRKDTAKGKWGEWISIGACHFPNQVSVKIYRSGARLLMDVKGISGGNLVGATPDHNHTERARGISELIARLNDLRNLQRIKFEKLSPSRPTGRDSALLVASESMCRSLGATLSAYVNHLRSEGRMGTDSVCLSDSIVASANPVKVRDEIRRALKGRSVQGLILIGSDIPVFELFERQAVQAKSNPSGMANYSSTDLPYGADDSFFSQPIAKSSLTDIYRKREKLDDVRDFMHQPDWPTRFAFDMTKFHEEVLAGRGTYKQTHWVSRILVVPAKGSSDMVSSHGVKPPAALLSELLARRLAWKPTDGLNIISATGDSSIRDPQAPESAFYLPGLHHPLSIAALGDGPLSRNARETHLYEGADLEKFIRHVDRNTTVLSLFDHGNSKDVGSLTSYDVGGSEWLPPVMIMQGCFNGQWMYDGMVDKSGKLNLSYEGTLVYSALVPKSPALVMIAAQAVAASGSLSATTKDTLGFALGWEKSTSIGARQLEYVESEMQAARAKLHSGAAASISRFGIIFAESSIFGDGTVEL